MKKTIVISVLSLFILSVFSSAALAETRITANARLSDADNESDDSNDNGTDNNSSGQTSRTEIKPATRVRADNKGERTESRIVDRNEKIVTIRDRQRANFQAAIERCDSTPRPEECKANMQKRLALVDKLQEKDLDNLKRFQEKRAEVAEHLKQLKAGEHFKQFKNDAKARVITAKAMSDTEARFKGSMKKADDAEKSRKDDRTDFEESREQWKKECANTKTDECKALDGKLALHVKAYLTHSLEMMIAHIEKIEERVTASEHLSETEAKEMLDKLSAAKAEVTSVKSKVDVLSETSTKDDVKAATEDVRKLWSSLKQSLTIHAEKVVNARMGGIIVQSEQLRVKLAKVLERMAENGVDTTTTGSLVAEFDAKLLEAKQAYESAQELLKTASGLTGDQRAAKVKEAQNMMKKAKDALKAAHELVQKIHKELKAKQQLERLTEVEAETTVEVEAEATASS